MKKFLYFIFLSIISLNYSWGQHDLEKTYKCLKTTNTVANAANVDSLTNELLCEFYLCFEIENAVELLQYRNEVLFKILEQNPIMVLKTLNECKNIPYSKIINDFECPIHDEIDLKKIYNTIKNIKNNSKERKDILKALQKAIQKTKLS